MIFPRENWTSCTSRPSASSWRSEEHTSELQSHDNLVCRLLLEKKTQMSGVRQEVLAAQPGRPHDGLVRVSVRGLLRVPPAGPGAYLMTAELDFENWTCPVPLRDTPNVVMGHGGGGAMSGELVEHLFLPGYGPAGVATEPGRYELADCAVVPA